MPKAKAGGYIDNGALADARRANTRMVEDLRLLVDGADRIGSGRRLQILSRLAVALADQSNALAEMERIRGR